MQLKAFWRSLIAAAAIAIFFGGTAQAQTSRAATQAEAGKPLALGKYVKHRSRHAKKKATRHSRHVSKKTAKKSSVSRKSTERTAATKKDIKDSAKTASVRKAAEELSAVANARAELNTSDQRASDMAAALKFYTPSRHENANASGTQISASDELNDLDKAANAASAISVAAPAPVVATTTTAAAAPVAAPMSDQIASSHDDAGDTWGQTSLIGKIFVAFGGLLTLASAARMFMA
ncbi:hypothetical protein ASC80_21050 [Afipia sp. Root123D2]|uniref:hypothetical protein n=1 Tax=Afipia sp. Root123D2 TaxID=1736436 RepID=UPI0006F22277|nr:hypothetical protein [Afipia sp. Root123D2]KQW18499.1 hypothetical protein ASC80_21050 [Afipia sp. Root123D2]